MNGSTPFLSARRRVGRTPRRVPPGPLAVRNVISVTTRTEIIQVTLAFNTSTGFPLLDVTGADPAKWTARYTGWTYSGATIELTSYNTLRITMDQVDVEAGAAFVSYSAAPSDITDGLGRQLPAFSNLPM
jgi:hypothetical protein